VGVRTGEQYLEGLARARTVYDIGGERHVGGVAGHPAFRNVTRSYATLFDLQHEPGLHETMTYPSPTSGDPVSLSFLQPKTHDDLVRRRRMMQVWAEWSMGMLGRTGDYLNSALQAMAGAASYFAGPDAAFGENVVRYNEYVRENDLLLTHTLIHPQANRSKRTHEQADPYLAAAVVRETDSGVVLRGARMLATIGPFADELLVFPSTVVKSTAEDAPYAFALAVPCDAPGLRFLCRETMDQEKSSFDHPFGSRFEEIDAVVVFDDVEVPFERVFILGQPELCNGLYVETTAVNFMTHQVVTRTIAKTEFFLGLASLMADAIQVEGFQHVQEKIAEMIVALESLRALRHAAESKAELSRFGLMTPAWAPLNAARNWYPRLYARLPEIVRQLGASGLMALPTEADVEGPPSEEVERYLQSATLGGAERVRLYRLAWDAAISSFAGRQELYEYFFFGDPVRMAGALVAGYDRSPYLERVREFLDRGSAESSASARDPVTVPSEKER
jgi:4-hydroxyphenylacetate 3-monooxygenase